MELVNLAQLLPRQADRLGDRPALRFKRFGLYHDITWRRYLEKSEAIAAALIDAGVKLGDRVGLIGENSADWLMADVAILMAGGVTVSPHAPLTARQIHYQLHDADVVWAFASNRTQLDKLRSVRAELPALRGIVVFDAAVSGVDAIPLSAFEQRGRLALSSVRGELDRRRANLTCDELATVMYTSGTTGNPKGVMLTHGNLLSNAVASLEVQPHRPDDLVLTWLPHTHIYARLVDHYCTLVSGITLALADSAETLVENLGEVHPTHLAAVPRFYEKLLSAVKTADPAETGRRLRRAFGPRLMWMSSGGAPLPNPIAEVYHAAGLNLMQGYGLTETSPVISFNTHGAHELGTVGRPVPGVEVKIADDGEIMTRGPHVMKGYWKNPEATAETIRDGWLYTGDLGKLDADGYLSITGRKKEMMVLSNGKKLVPANLEGLVVSDDCIDQVMICGEGRNFLTALIVPQWANVRAALADESLSPSDDDLTTHPAVLALLVSRCKAALSEVSHTEQIRKFVVLPRPFSVENDEMTVSLKLRRQVILEKYRVALADLYRSDG